MCQKHGGQKNEMGSGVAGGRGPRGFTTKHTKDTKCSENRSDAEGRRSRTAYGAVVALLLVRSLRLRASAFNNSKK
jgi:hypothetical protein